MNKNKNKSYVLYIKGVEAFEKYKIPNVELMETKKFTDKQLANIAKGDMFLLSRQYNQKLWKMLKKIYAKQFKIASIFIDSSIANLSFELFDKKQNLHTFKFHTEDSVLDFKVFKTKKEIGRGNVTPFFFVDSFTGPDSYSGKFKVLRELDITPMHHTPIKIDKDKCTFKFNVGGFTEKDCSLGELANKPGENEAKQGDNISATIKLAPDRLEANLINNLLQILDDKCLGISSSTTLADKVAMILHEVEHYKFQKDFDGDRVSISFPIDATNLVDDDKRVNYTPECSIPLADKEIASKKAEEVSEYLDNAEYDMVVNKITNDISMHYRHIKIAGRHMFSIPSDFRERLCDLSYLPDLENRFKQFDNIGILQQELLLKSKDEDMLESIEELTFAQVLELFTVLADMKGMIKIKDEESGEYCLKHLEKKAELIANDIKVADITDIKISKMGVLLLTASDTIGEFGEDSKKCNWSLFKNLEEAINVLRTIHNEQKIYTLLKYQSGANTIFSNIVPRISKASFGQEFEVLLDADALFYYRNKIKFNVEETELSCKPIKIKKEHNVNMGNNWAHFAIEILEEDIKTKISIQPYIRKTKTVDIEKQALVDEDEYLKVINFINNNVPAERLSSNIIFYRYDIVVPKDFKERITSLLDSSDYKNKFKFISDPHKYLIDILYLTTSNEDIAHNQLGKLTFEQLLELFTILADVSLDAPVELGELNANSQAQDRTKRARPTNMKVEVYPTTTSSEEGEVNPLTNDEVNK